MAQLHTMLDMFRAAPVTHGLVIVVPVVLAIAQLANSLVTDLSFAVSVPFALLVIGFTAVVMQFNVAQFRRTRLERELLE